ncbi:penicillin acylase family protein [Alishewanella sp. 16-MA]|uniref:Penicillin acylase family protein n=1 Tax=Alishewanella maricola TaxID=2795740 RepID=A0ABS8C6J5_9ALTE|nr:penicillin acylase family protein [Alishewanella maricola]MCB5227964.1 penicillin acylase family protein [Alishewanella maricola]
MKIISWLLSLVVAVILIVLAVAYYWLNGSLPDYNGRYQAPIAHPVSLKRDQLGYLTIHATDRSDTAYALGFAHAQERFFQMDLSRRSAAGELSALFGQQALNTDISHRRHLFRQRAEHILTQLKAPDLELLAAYSRGVNDGLNRLRQPPFEYLLLQTTPEPWLEQDSLLVIYSMYLDLQGKMGRDDYAMTKLKAALPEDWYQFLQQHSPLWQAAIDGSEQQAIALPSSPYPSVLQQQLSCIECTPADAVDLGSNNFAVAGHLTGHGAAILADDMHLSLRVPGVWFKTQLNWVEDQQAQQVTGLSLPGTPAIVVGSNGKIAWGFTNSTADWHDLISLTLSDDEQQYLSPNGWQPLEYITERITIRDAPAHSLLIKQTEWGPLIPFADGQPYALRWIAHDPQAVNLNLRYLEKAESAAEVLRFANTMGIPAQNVLVADQQGHIGWSIFGPMRQRHVADWDTAQDWSKGDNYWGEQLEAAAYPQLLNPTSGRLWSANARTVGGEFYKLLGNGGYDLGARGKQIADALAALPQADELALHQIQLDIQAHLLQPWQALLLDTLSPERSEQYQLTEFRQLIAQSSLKADVNDVGYTLLRQFRLTTLELTFAPLSALLEQVGSRSSDLKYSMETPFWLMLAANRADTLPANYQSWQDLLLSAAKQTEQNIQAQYGSLTQANWGTRNTSKIKHPLSGAIPLIGHWLNMADTPLSGDSHMPKVQHPAFGQSQRMVVAPGFEELGVLVISSGQSGHPLSPFYRSDHPYWLAEVALPFLPGPEKYQQQLIPNP